LSRVPKWYMAHAEPGLLRIEVVYCPQPGQSERVSLQLPPGSTLQNALDASAMLRRHALAEGAVQWGIWGRMQPPSTLLRDLDRVELYRPLQVDPKEARRLRYKRAKATKPAKPA
jgi:putative ubiquitin-RnfH superfamily antitoxin RatB of RatAB toxin-antitoxin module